MTNNPESSESRGNCRPRGVSSGVCGGTYGLGFIGAAVYFLQHATSFWEGVLGIVKALVWPAVVVYHVLEFLKM